MRARVVSNVVRFVRNKWFRVQTYVHLLHKHLHFSTHALSTQRDAHTARL